MWTCVELREKTESGKISKAVRQDSDFKQFSHKNTTPLRQDVTFLLQTTFNTDFHTLGVTFFSSRFSLTYKIRFSPR